MHTIKITPNLLFEYQCTSGKFIRFPNRIEKIDSVARIESNRIETFLPELECSTDESVDATTAEKLERTSRGMDTDPPSFSSSAPSLAPVSASPTFHPFPSLLPFITKFSKYNLVPVRGWWCPAAGKVTVGLTLHWPCVTDFSGLSTCGFTA